MKGTDHSTGEIPLLLSRSVCVFLNPSYWVERLGQWGNAPTQGWRVAQTSFSVRIRSLAGNRTRLHWCEADMLTTTVLAVLFWPHAILGIYLIYHTNYSRFETLVRRKRKSWKIEWLGLDKLSNIAKIKCHEISPFQNCKIKLSWNFPTIIKVCTCFLKIWCNQFVIHRFYSNRLLPFWMEFPVTGFLLRNFWIHVTLHLWHQH